MKSQEYDASNAARVLASKRKRFGGGRPKVLRQCQKCKQSFGTRELAKHISACTSVS